MMGGIGAGFSLSTEEESTCSRKCKWTDVEGGCKGAHVTLEWRNLAEWSTRQRKTAHFSGSGVPKRMPFYKLASNGASASI